MAILGTILVGWVMADFLSGFWHWLEDRYFREDWPIIGPYIAVPNQRHHETPAAFLGQGYWSRNWTTILPASFVLAPCVWLGAPSWLLVAIAAVSQANEIHAWSHQRCGSLIRTLQDTGILQHPRTHAKHHKAPFDCRYCVITEWLNPIMDGVGFWTFLEMAIFRSTGIKARDSPCDTPNSKFQIPNSP